MFQGGLDQKADQVMVLQDRAARDDRPGDFDLVERQNVDQGRRSPGGIGQAFGKPLPDVALSLDHQRHEDRVQQPLDIRISRRTDRLTGLAKLDNARQKAFAIAGIPAAGQSQKLSGLDGLDDQPPRIPNPISMIMLWPNENMLKRLCLENDKKSDLLSR